MTQTKNIRRMLLIATLILGYFATAAYSDSFVDEAALEALNSSKAGRSSFATHPVDNVAVKSNHGDSFVNGAAMEALENVRFTKPEFSSHMTGTNKGDTASSPMEIKDSFAGMGEF